MLLLKRHLVELVRAGTKRQTLRFWHGPLVRAGQLTHTPGLGKIRILAIDELANADAITDQDARDDGFASRAALFDELTRIYGTTAPPGKRLFRIRFEWPVEPAASPVAAPSGIKKAKPKTARRKAARNRMTRKQRNTLKQFVVDRAHASSSSSAGASSA